jgi:hypothetical protein
MAENNDYRRLYEVALQTRNFEISLYWQRSNYFLVLNTAVAVGYFTTTNKGYGLVIALFGAFSSILWLRVCAGSKFWQSRWEQRLRSIEQLKYANADLFNARWETILADVRDSLTFGEHGHLRRLFDQLVLAKPSVSFEMVKLACGFAVVWVGIALFEIYELLAPIQRTSEFQLQKASISQGGEMDPIIFVPVVLALQFAAFGWRIAREIAIGDERRRTWFPLPDYINVVAMLVVVACCVVWPTIVGVFGSVSKGSLVGAAVLIAMHPVSMAAHYRLLWGGGRHLYDSLGKDYPWITGQEVICVTTSLGLMAFAVLLFILN